MKRYQQTHAKLFFSRTHTWETSPWLLAGKDGKWQDHWADNPGFEKNQRLKFFEISGPETKQLWPSNKLLQYLEVKWKLLSYVWFFATPWTVAHQTPLSMEFSRQEYWSGLPCPSPGIFLTQGSNPGLLLCRQILYYLSYSGNHTKLPL